MKLILSAFSLFFNCCMDATVLAIRSTNTHTFGVCKLPYLTDRNFRRKCSQYEYSLGFVCDVKPLKFHLTETTNFQKILASADGRFAFCACHYNAVENKTACFNRTIVALDDHNTDNGELGGENSLLTINEISTPASSDDTSAENRQQAPDVVLTLSVVYMNFFENIGDSPDDFTHWWKPNCDTQNKLFPSSHLYDYSTSEENYKKEFIDFHRRMLRARWKTNSCATDIIIFAFDDTSYSQLPLDDSNLTQVILDLRNSIQIEVSDRSKTVYGDQLTKTIEKINSEYAHLSVAEKIKRFLQQLKTMPTKASIDANAGGVPRWALITFGVCICVSILAAVVGSFVNDDTSRKKRSTSLAGKNSRKWRAGFSGGMWASV